MGSSVCGTRSSFNPKSSGAPSAPPCPLAFPRCLKTALGFFGYKFQLWLGSSITLHFLLPEAPRHHGNGAWHSKLTHSSEFIALSDELLHPSSCLTALFICSGSDEVIDYPASDVCAVLNLILLTTIGRLTGRSTHLCVWMHTHTHTHTLLRKAWSNSLLDMTFQKVPLSACNVRTVFSSGSLGENEGFVKWP